LGKILDPVNYVGQSSTRGVLHIQQPSRIFREHTLIVDANDIVMIQLRERLWLGTMISRNLQGDQPRHRLLTRKKHGGKRSPAQLQQDLKVVNRLTW